MPKVSLWSCIRDVINTYSDGELVSRQQLIAKIKEAYPEKLSECSFDLYRHTLTKVKVLGWISNGNYKKLQHFPKSLTTTKASKLESHYKWEKPDWKDWFSENIEDRIKML